MVLALAAAPFLIQLLINMPRKAAGVDQVKQPDGFSGSWLQLASVIWGVKQSLEDVSLSLLLSVCHSAFQMNKTNQKK